MPKSADVSPVNPPIVVAFGADHAGFRLKDQLAERIRLAGYNVLDVGTFDETSVDFPDIAALVARAVVDGEAALGVLVCGSGNGMAIAANKVDGIRAAVVHDVTSASFARRHNNANVLCIGERFTGPEVAAEAVEAWLTASFEGGRHARRVDKIALLEQTRLEQTRIEQKREPA